VGRSRTELLAGVSPVDFTHPDDVATTRAHIDALLAGEPERAWEKRYLRPNGGSVWVSMNASALRDERGAYIGSSAIVADISERKAADESLRSSEQQSLRMQADLRDALRAKDDFLGQVSHELRNPVHELRGNAEVLHRRWRSLPVDVQEESLSEMHLQAKRLDRLVENMMVLSRFERGLMPALEPVLLHRVLQETLRDFEQRYPAAKFELICDAPPPPVETTTSTIDQIVWNLLTNAQKYGGNGTIEVEVRGTTDSAEVVVRDAGPGVPEEDMPRLFEPYFRSSATPEHVAGLGLGLSVCKRLIEAQGGQMWATRRQPRGMEFGLRLPAIDAGADWD
jgi:PAS domain S-box-containing protein